MNKGTRFYGVVRERKLKQWVVCGTSAKMSYEAADALLTALSAAWPEQKYHLIEYTD